MTKIIAIFACSLLISRCQLAKRADPVVKPNQRMRAVTSPAVFLSPTTTVSPAILSLQWLPIVPTNWVAYNSTGGLAWFSNSNACSAWRLAGSFGTNLGNMIIEGSFNYAANVTPWNAPDSKDFLIVLAAAKAIGRGNYYSGDTIGTTLAYPDIGAAQAADTNSTTTTTSSGYAQ